MMVIVSVELRRDGHDAIKLAFPLYLNESISTDLLARDDIVGHLIHDRIHDLHDELANNPKWWHRAYPELEQ